MAKPSVYSRRNLAAQADGWDSYGQKRYWTADETARIKRLVVRSQPDRADSDRPGSLMGTELNERVNPRTKARTPFDWQARALHVLRPAKGIIR